MSCPLCKKRKPGRFCPAKGETICPVCCGTAREVTMDCPPGCAYLVAAHRYEDAHQRPVPADTPFLDVDLPRDVIHTRQSLLEGLAFTIAKFAAAQPAASDPDVLAALQALAETWKTLATGIYYEKPPETSAARALYSELTQFLREARQHEAGQPGLPPAVERFAVTEIKDGEIFALLVFLYRMGLLRSNGRPRSRRFVEFLRSQLPQSPELPRAEPRIIVP